MLKQVDHGVQPASEPLQLPHNIDVEQALLGALMLRNDSLDLVHDELLAQHFYDPLHGQIYETLANLIQDGKQASPQTLRTFFENAPPLDEHMTVAQYLARLLTAATTTAGVASYAKLIRDLALRRTLIEIGRDIVSSAMEAHLDYPPETLVEDAEQCLYSVAETRSERSGVVTMAVAVERAVASANDAFARKASKGLRTGFIDLDAKLGGLNSSDLIILAGRPSMGKTALATNIAYNIAERGVETMTEAGELQMQPAPVLFFSLEMSAEQLANRQIASHAETPGHKVRTGSLSEEEIEAYVRSGVVLSRLPVHIDETGGISIATMTSRARRMKRKHGIALVVVDYLQLMRGTGRKGDGNRVQEVSEITIGLKALAKELQVPVLALSQLSRQVEGRENKRPQLSDLRESGSIEQDADVVMFVYREEYYVERLKPDDSNLEAYIDWEARLKRCAGKAEVIIGKQRHGPVGTVELAFESQFTRFANLARAEFGNGGGV